jgi:hypothetical protein
VFRIAVALSAVAAIGAPTAGASSSSSSGVSAVGEGAFCPPFLLGDAAHLPTVFAGNRRARRVVPYGRRSVIIGRVTDSQGFGLPGEPICVEQRPRIPSAPYTMLGTTTTRADGGWSFKLPSGPSRRIRVNYGGDPEVISTFLDLGVRARATLRLRAHRTRPGRPVFFSGRIPGPLAGRRVVLLRGTVPGARRKFLVRRARTDVFGRFRFRYSFSPVAAPTKFVFWVVVPVQRGYPYLLGRSSKRFVRVRP